MKPSPAMLPVFPLDRETNWEDLENDLAANVEYQNAQGCIRPIMLFAPDDGAGKS